MTTRDKSSNPDDSLHQASVELLADQIDTLIQEFLEDGGTDLEVFTALSGRIAAMLGFPKGTKATATAALLYGLEEAVKP